MEINWKNKRYRVKASYPGSVHKIDDVIEVDSSQIKSINYDSYPDVFKPLKWHECRSKDFNSMFTIKFCRITETHGYWENGAILPVVGYLCKTEIKEPFMQGFMLKGYGESENYEMERVEPATEEEFMKWVTKNKISIRP